MRQGHQQNYNKRSRGRGRGGRPGGGGGGGSGGSGGSGGGGNPINRVYDSNGPEVKVRGTAQTVADKYMQLARDAHSSGDIVMAESYNQYAEHYLRILAAAQAYNQQHMGPQQYRRPVDGEEGGESPGEEYQSTNAGQSDGDQQPPAVAEESGQQLEAQGYESDTRQMRRPQDDRQRRQFERVRPQNDQPPESGASQSNGGEAGRQWEAPSFLRRASQGSGEAVRERRPRIERPKRDRQSDGSSGDADAIAADMPEGPVQTD
jgi:hypothetical protein